jgi:F-type H+-transporting ATPase subunit h
MQDTHHPYSLTARYVSAPSEPSESPPWSYPNAIVGIDLVRDMYMSELKKFKPTPVKASDAQGQVQQFSPPKAPVSPEEMNIASELKAYEDQVVEVEGQSTGPESVLEDEDAWFVEEDDEKPQNEVALP